ncbi:RWD domain-containing protein 3 isoform X2 [Notolabrus celidotus]|uniref:RWD domain-containing protein 3 isoform X2 n=1 Tax=Notolabrus celidotus TaxID=1203425 RepID=UPI0014906507|nr:RWD domain-containing protein 3 isoform X2 [Notolabrus celidotus]
MCGPVQQLTENTQDGLVVQINCTVGGGGGGGRQLDVSLLFRLHPGYPSCPPDISVSSTRLSRSQCHNIKQKLLDQAASLPPEPMVHQLVEWLQCVEVTHECRGEEEVKETEKEEEWTAVLSLDHIRSQNRYIGLLERWSQQLQLTGRLLLGRSILIILQGARNEIKEFCRLLKTVKVDVDSCGKKCKERMMKVLTEAPLSSSSGPGTLQGFVVVNYQSSSELTAAFQEMNLTELYQQILPSLSE